MIAEIRRFIQRPCRLLTSCPSFVPSFFPPKKRKPVIEVVGRATGRGADSSVSLGAPRQRPVRHEPRCRPGAEPAPCAPARAHVLLRDLHLAHRHQRPAGRPPSRMGSSGWCSPTRPPLLPLLPTISIYVLWALQRAQQLDVLSRNRLWPAVFRCRWPLCTRHCKCTEMGTACVHGRSCACATARTVYIDIVLVGRLGTTRYAYILGYPPDTYTMSRAVPPLRF